MSRFSSPAGDESRIKQTRPHVLSRVCDLLPPWRGHVTAAAAILPVCARPPFYTARSPFPPPIRHFIPPVRHFIPPVRHFIPPVRHLIPPVRHFIPPAAILYRPSAILYRLPPFYTARPPFYTMSTLYTSRRPSNIHESCSTVRPQTT